MKQKQLNLKKIALIGRVFDEYYEIFNLKNINLPGEKILDAGSGVSSFTAEACAKGLDVTGADNIYCIPAAELYKKSTADIATVKKELEHVLHKYKWGYYKNPEGLGTFRQKALDLFIKDYKKYGKKHYVYADLPKTRFKNKQFTVTLMSHLLFLFEDKLSYWFHRDVIKELIRITSKEIRIYPACNMAGEKCGYVDMLRKDRELADVTFSLEKTGYEFLKGAKTYLSIKKKGIK
jgi:ubiquinone/menaquinone biosynthesis C-methylase UbiE